MLILGRPDRAIKRLDHSVKLRPRRVRAGHRVRVDLEVNSLARGHLVRAVRAEGTGQELQAVFPRPVGHPQQGDVGQGRVGVAAADVAVHPGEPHLLQFLAIGAGAAGAILAAAKLEVWIGLTAGASAAALAYLGYLQVDNTIVTYNQTASRLAVLEREWRALSPEQQHEENAFKHLVSSCEAALATELSGWVQQMNDTMEDIRRNQKSAVDPAEHQADDSAAPEATDGR